MNIPPFWARAESEGIAGVGWSFRNLREAEESAAARARENAARHAAGEFERSGRDYYSERPLREPVLREFRADGGDPTALLTRNAYGALVLNTERMMFVDVDIVPTTPLAGFLARWLGKKTDHSSQDDPQGAAIARATAWAREHAPWQWRVYRTKAGLRFLAAHRLFEIDEPLVKEAFEALGADPLYRKLCSLQKCFRARLTPKPWRAEYRAASVRWPFADSAAKRRHEEWESGYLECCQRYATCHALPAIGAAREEPAFATLIAFHDAAVRIDSGLPLA